MIVSSRHRKILLTVIQEEEYNYEEPKSKKTFEGFKF